MWRMYRVGTRSMRVGGVDVVTNFGADIGRAAAVRARIGLALELIDHYAPRVGACLRRDVVAIFLWRAGGSSYNSAMRTITLDLRWSMAGVVEDLAMTLVHEATHARQFALGVRTRPQGELLRRVESHALAETIAFSERLPPGPGAKPSVASLDTQWWTWDKKAARTMEGLEDAGFPAGPFRVFGRALRLLGLAR